MVRVWRSIRPKNSRIARVPASPAIRLVSYIELTIVNDGAKILFKRDVFAW